MSARVADTRRIFFGHGGVRDEAERLNVPFLGEIPLSLDVRLAGDAGIAGCALGDGPVAEAYRGHLARRLVGGGMGVIGAASLRLFKRVPPGYFGVDGEPVPALF